MGCCRSRASRRHVKQVDESPVPNETHIDAVLSTHADDLEAQDVIVQFAECPSEVSLDEVQPDGLGLLICLGYDDRQLIMGEFVMLMSPDDIMGEGSFSICRKGIHLRTGELVAIKTFKDADGDPDTKAVQLQKFIKQINILEELSRPFVVPKDDSLWSPLMNQAKAGDLFMKIVDYSKEPTGKPGPDPNDGVLYLVTELASYSLDDYLYERSTMEKPLSRHAVQEFTRAILLVTAGLHAKGFCHLDLKPENLMLFNSRLKLIDVDGCVAIGSKVLLGDASVSFSPAFCAPEWGKWMTCDTESDWIIVRPALDAWSVGMTLCQLISLDVVLEEKYAEFSGKHARHEFLSWLGSLQEPPIPDCVRHFVGMMDLLNRLLECDKHKRETPAKCLSCPLLCSGGMDNRVMLEEEETTVKEEILVARTVRHHGEELREDTSGGTPAFKGVAWQLNVDCDEEDLTSWVLCDMWITQENRLCFFDLPQSKRKIYMDRDELSTLEVALPVHCPRGYGLHLKTASGCSKLAVSSADKQSEWSMALNFAKAKATAVPSKTDEVADSKSCIHMECINRRIPVPHFSHRDYEPVFRVALFKLAQGTDGTERGHWLLREMWISMNFHLVYYSVRDGRDLIYYNAQDLERVTIVRIPNGQLGMPWAFRFVVSPHNRIEFVPGVFACVSEQARERWIQEFQIHQLRHSGLVKARASTLRTIFNTAEGSTIIAKALNGDCQHLKEVADSSQHTRIEPEVEPVVSASVPMEVTKLEEQAKKCRSPKPKAKGKAKIDVKKGGAGDEKRTSTAPKAQDGGKKNGATRVGDRASKTERKTVSKKGKAGNQRPTIVN